MRNKSGGHYDAPPSRGQYGKRTRMFAECVVNIGLQIVATVWVMVVVGVAPGGTMQLEGGVGVEGNILKGGMFAMSLNESACIYCDHYCRSSDDPRAYGSGSFDGS